MNIWRAVPRELAAAGRSLRYDLRRDSGSGAGDPTEPDEYPEYDAYTRRGRRTRTAVAAAVLTVGGAAATYLGVVGGLTALLAGDSSPPAALPGVTVTADPAVPPPFRSMATGPASPPAAGAPPVIASYRPGPEPAHGPDHEVDDGPAASRPAERAPAPLPGPERPTPTRSAPVPTPAPEPTCGCPAPTPTPTPTSSPTYSPSPSPTPVGSTTAAPSAAGAAHAS